MRHDGELVAEPGAGEPGDEVRRAEELADHEAGDDAEGDPVSGRLHETGRAADGDTGGDERTDRDGETCEVGAELRGRRRAWLDRSLVLPLGSSGQAVAVIRPAATTGAR